MTANPAAECQVSARQPYPAAGYDAPRPPAFIT